MLNEREARHHLRSIVETLLDQGDVHVPDVITRFRSDANPSELVQLEAESFDRWLIRAAKDVLAQAGRSGNGQYRFHGMEGVFDLTVTTVDTDGQPMLKKTANATVHDLKTNRDYHRKNTDGARAALQRAEGLYNEFVPVMELHGFMEVYEAVDFLELTQLKPDEIAAAIAAERCTAEAPR